MDADPKLTRREMLTRTAGAVVAAGAAATAGYLLYDPIGDAGLPKPSDATLRLKDFFTGIELPASTPRISVATGEESAIEKMVRTAIGQLDPGLGLRRFVTKGDVVLIKPNAGFDRAPHLGATTHPDVIRTLVRMCLEAGAASVIITDNPIEAPEACFAKSGIKRAAEETGAKIVLPEQRRFETVVVRDTEPVADRGEALGRWSVLYAPLREATKVIGVAPIKDHNLCGGSMNLKNWYGLLGGRRNQFHQAIHHIISDLGWMISPTLIIADGTRVMMRNGPTGGRISDVKPGGEVGRPTVVAAVDPVACDAWCYRHLLGRDPAKLAYLEMAARKIAAQTAAGSKRLGEADWQVYQRRGQVATANV